MVEGGDTNGGASAVDAFKFGFKGLQKAVAAAVNPNEPASSSSDTAVAKESVPANAAGPEGGSWLSWADKARKAVEAGARQAYAQVPTSESAREVKVGEHGDLETGSSDSGQPTAKGLPSLAWATKAAGRLSKQVTEATEKHLERAKSLELGEQAKKWHTEVTGNFSGGLGKLQDAHATATAALQEKGKVAQQKAKELGSQGKEKMKEAQEKAAKKAQEAKDKAANAAGAAKNVAGAAKDKLAKAGESLQGLGSLATSPAKLAQFAGIFVLGTMLISISFSFLPMLPIAPQKFALLFAFGSMTMLSSFAVLKGPKNFAGTIVQREKLPFSVAYVVGLVGTIVATIILKSYILTAVFGVIQAFALLYFLASFIPGGKAALNMCGRCCRRVAQRVACRKQ